MLDHRAVAQRLVNELNLLEPLPVSGTWITLYNEAVRRRELLDRLITRLRFVVDGE